MEYVVYALAATFVVFLIKNNRSLQKKLKEFENVPEEKATKTLSDIKRRVLFDRLADEGTFDGLITTEEEFIELQEIEAERYDIMEKQSRFFLECALNLMAHSYEDLEDAKQVAAEMYEMAFDEDILKTYSKKNPGTGDVHETI
ncbi:hypothetical protein EVB81_025 [Rhizobium phage RHph_I46]|uniref:Uncharacterized protein n=1 Tax=Rhizobium phage RHph_I1_9 TaxID=2509729 RepID=A0A7S5R9G3_9CAUD|nr:hypothetical protein PP936_gp025 [Rhizobium phage RHph_I1_9]QIG69594.1 hypothetical protein EVB81_025 [Rhizobium phage RHph_I46]QIG70875.1 hypothetical protein EVB92_025 [Rhizobium phage RHph_I9]QIG73462.1 hypothetical protein EVC04_025 [Rhizobium phage RHph_I1_9]QIG76214.1 hypothetical protein EVC25_025 [Rhizobium phage RHph_I34]